jgi:four helix bundle protein
MKNDLIDRTKKFAVNIYRLAEQLPNTRGADIIARQIIRSGSSIAANYRAVQRAKSDADFINKLIIVQEETDETLFWLEYIDELSLIKNIVILKTLMNECEQLLSIMTASIITSKNKKLKK